MSLRPNIAGFDLATFSSLLGGSSERHRVEAVVDDVAARLSPVEAQHVQPILGYVRLILTGRLVRGAVEKEDSSLVNAVIALATTGQRPMWLDVENSRAGFVSFASRFPPAPSDVHGVAGRPGRAGLPGQAGQGPPMQTLVRWALLQRPLFGRSQGGWWSTYGFLSNDEVARLLEYHRAYPALSGHDPQFALAFFRRLDQIRAAGLDYWFHCS